MAKVYSIKCPECNAPLELLGGKNVSVVVCKYCKSLIDLKKNYRVLSKFSAKKLPNSQFQIGLKGEIDGVKWQIIGLIAYSENTYIDKTTWIDYMLYSKLYGYAWLTYDNGALIFTRRIHSIPTLDMSPRSTPKDLVVLDGKEFKFYECYYSYIVFAMGELTFVAKNGDRVGVCEAIAPPYGLNKESYLSGIEYSISRYLDNPKEICESFGVSPIKKEPLKHPLKPLKAPILKTVSEVSIIFFAIVLFLIAITNVKNRDRVVAKDYFDTNSTQSVKIVDFNISHPEHLVELSIHTNLNNDWIDYDISVEDANKTEIFSTEDELSYYYGYEGGESWSEGSLDDKIYFKVPEAGSYRLIISSPPHKKVVTSHIEIKEGVIRTLYLWALVVFYLFMFIIYWLVLWAYESSVWSEVVEDDD